MVKNKFFKHLHMVTKHRAKVFVNCIKCGLFWRGLVHDLSKYSLAEFWEGVKYYSGTRSPISACREKNGYSYAWIHHLKRNKHHIEYWHDFENEIQMNMPYKYAVECICDKIASAKCYRGKTFKPEHVLNHWLSVGILAPTNDNMRKFFTTVFTDYVNNGEKYILNRKYMKKAYNNIVLKKD